MNSNMKTITLDDEAYSRLKSWKKSSGDSFSKVVRRVVPRAGTLAAMLHFAEQRIPRPDEDSVLEESVENRLRSKTNPWIS